MLPNLKPVGTITVDASVDNLSTSAWEQIISSVVKAASFVEIFNSTGATLKISQGASGEEDNSLKLLPYTILQGGTSAMLPMAIQAGKPVSVKSLDNASTAGILVLNLFG